jgi:hypothetical protein
MDIHVARYESSQVPEALRNGRSIESLLSGDVADRRNRWTAVGNALRARQAVVIPNALRPEIAETIATSLERSGGWSREKHHPVDRPYFQFWRHALPCDGTSIELVQALRRVMGSPESKRFMGDLSGTNCDGEFVMGVARYDPGDYSYPHNDDGGWRALTYVWYLCRPWVPGWGGHLVWCQTGAMLTPGFNMLLLFEVTKESLHFVSPVAEHAQGSRIDIHGWWQSSVLREDNRSGARDYNGVNVCPGLYGSPTGFLEGRTDLVVI